jgi:hypothetical protein
VADVSVAARHAELTMLVDVHRNAQEEDAAARAAGEPSWRSRKWVDAMADVLERVAELDPGLAVLLDAEWWTRVPAERVRARAATDVALAWTAFDLDAVVSREDVARVCGVAPGQVARWCAMPGAPQPTRRDVTSGALRYRAEDWMEWRPARVGRPAKGDGR